MLRFVIILPLLFSFCHASPTSEIIEYFAKNFSKELAEEGGEVAMAKALRKISAKYGDDSLKVFRKLSPRSVTSVSKYGDDGFRLVSRYGTPAAYVLRKEGRNIVKLARIHGDEIVEVFARHPGLGEPIVRELGPQYAVSIGKKLTTEEMIKLLKAAPRLRKSGTLAHTLALVNKYGKNALATIIDHPVLIASGVGACVLLYHSDGIGKTVGATIGDTIHSSVEHALGINGFDFAGLAIVIALIIGTALLLKYRK